MAKFAEGQPRPRDIAASGAGYSHETIRKVREVKAIAALDHGDIEQIVELKSQAEAIRVYTAQKQIGKDAELAATEVVRRAERGIGLAIRKGQEAGEIRKQGDDCRTDLDGHATLVRSPSDFLPKHELSSTRGGVYALTDGVTAEEFEAAIHEAKAESNLSRANVVRKAKGRPAPAPPRHEVLHRTHHIKPERVLGETVTALEGLRIGLSLLTSESYQGLDPAKRDAWGLA